MAAGDRSGQLPETSTAGLHVADSGGSREDREQAARAADIPQQQLTRADVQSMLGTGRVDRAAAALDALQKEAQQAWAQSQWIFEYLELVTLFLPRSDDVKAGKAELLDSSVRAWRAAQKDMANSLVWAVDQTRAQLAAIREAWEGKLQALFSRTTGGEGDGLQALPNDAHALVQTLANGFGSMECCLVKMRQRVADYLQSSGEHRAAMAATACVLIAQVRPRS